MKNKHTQGKWMVNILDFETLEITTEDKTICTIDRQYLNLDQDQENETQANAKLIAAAPKLLENLKEMVHMFWANETTYNREGFLSKYPNHYIFDAEAVIKEATV